MPDRFDICLPLLLQHEGGFVNDPHDPGGATNLGVTLAAWEQWVKRASSVDEIRSLTAEQVKPLYRAEYWNAVSADELPRGVDYAVFDCAVNQGPGRARKWLQTAAGAVPDGVIGPNTLAAVRTAGTAAILSKFDVLRASAYRSLPNFDRFGEGWMNRLDDVLRQAQQMAASP